MKTKILLLVIISLSLLNSCSRYETCERLTWQRRHIVDNFNNRKIGVNQTKLTFSGCKFTNINYDSSIGSNKTATLSFDFDLDPDFGRRGLFVSGNVLYGVLNNTKKVLIF